MGAQDGQVIAIEPSTIIFGTVAQHLRVTVTNAATGLVTLIGAGNIPKIAMGGVAFRYPKGVTLCVETVDAANAVYFTVDSGLSTPSVTLGMQIGSMASPTYIPCVGGITPTVDAIRLVAPAGNTHVQAYFEFALGQ